MHEKESIICVRMGYLDGSLFYITGGSGHLVRKEKMDMILTTLKKMRLHQLMKQV